ncbi:MAG: M56 family metallopeptidase [Planctomycetota bacterium]
MNSNLLNLVAVHLWQVTLLFAICLMATSFLRRYSVRFAAIIWIVFFVKCLTPPLVTSPTSLLGYATPTVFSEPPQVVLVPNVDATQPAKLELASSGRTSTSSTGSTDALLRWISPTPRTVRWLLSSSWVVGSLWAVGAIGFAGLAAIQYRRVLGRLRSVKSFENESGLFRERLLEAERLVKSFAARLDFRDEVRLRISEGQSGPFSFGVLTPTIVLPRDLLESNVAHEHVIAHELVHLWRRDPLIGWLQTFAQIFFWFHPGVPIATRKLNECLEIGCDEDAVRLFCLDRPKYSRALLHTIELQSSVVSVPQWAPCILRSQITHERISAVLSRKGDRYSRKFQVAIAVTLLLLLLPSAAGSTLQFRPNQIAFAPPRGGASAQLNFLAGSWDVFYEEQRIARTEFTFEKSGRMLREDWTSTNGATAQGITFFDPSVGKWRMTFVDWKGTITELSGDWQQEKLALDGVRTHATGDQGPVRMILQQSGEDRLQASGFSKPSDDWQLEYTIHYRRSS